jgi:DNA helicase-2/ATP-dependent DNA helicase PcrA
MPIDLSDLNNEQCAAVLCTEGPLLVLAGAGSGKTRVLTYRIAHLIEGLGVSPYQIMAITFTNKAAAEMRERLGRILANGSRGMWVATFHAMCVRLLRQDADRLVHPGADRRPMGYSRNFTIYDEDDSKRLVKAIYAEQNIDTRQFAINAVRARISKAKNDLVSAAEFEATAQNGYDRLVARVYNSLQQRLQRADAMDFDDLLMNSWLLLSTQPEVLAAYQARFRYLHIDEYQDTNRAQYLIAKLLAEANRNIMVVGDDDQSIYSWRGADIRNILEFERDYPNCTVIKLEQNYRSTQTILEAANAVIANNQQRKPKRLFSKAAEGDAVSLYQAADERDEGRWIAGEVERLRRQHNRRYRDFAVFYRTNAQSRVLEDMLLRAGLPYRVVGGTRFFDRAEIRDLMAYLKLVVNPADEISAKRIINVPKRGIGKTSAERIDDIARSQQLSFFEAAEAAISDADFGKKTQESLAGFVQLIKDARHYSGSLRSIVEMVVEKSGLISALLAERSDEANGRIENIQEFFGVAEEFELTHQPEDAEWGGAEDADTVGTDSAGADGHPAGASGANGRPADAKDVDGVRFAANLGASGADGAIGGTALADTADADAPGASDGDDAGHHPADPAVAENLIRFMEWLALRSDLDSIIADDDYLTLMTVHSAKGLEFPVVFIAGMEQSLFPHIASFDGEAGIEEERRLAYVAITRARELLYLTYAQCRNLFGNVQANPRSCFVAEIPERYLKSCGVGSDGYLGLGWEKRGDRRGVFGSGTGYQADEGRVYGGGRGGAGSSSPASGRQTGRTAASGSGYAGGRSGAVGMGSQDAAAKKQQQELMQERSAVSFAVGDQVDHKIFGRGEVKSVDGDALHIHFPKISETKKLLKGYAPIVKIS